MPTRPSALPPPWATGAGRRGTIDPGDETQGAIAGTPVPTLKNNALWGRLSDWARFFGLAVVSGCTYQGFVISGMSPNWQPVDDASGEMSYPDARMRVTTIGGGDRQAVGVLSPVMAGGQITAVSAVVHSLLTTTGTTLVSVQISGYDITGITPVSGTFSAAATTTGTLALPLTSGVATIYGPLTIQIIVRPGATVNDFLSLTSFSVVY